jgi:hypothetical protein
MNHYLTIPESLQLLEKLPASGISHTYDHQKHRLIFLDSSHNEVMHFRLPIVVHPPEKKAVDEEFVKYVILLIQSGSCALGYFEDGVNIDHKVFRSYMVRKKQGKSQIKYLKTRGKSKAGSRVRLGETLDFFENINGRLQEYFEHYEIDRIAISCSKTLIPYLFNSKINTPFDKRDKRILKIPKHVHLPIHEVLIDVNKFLLKGELVYDENHKHLVEKLVDVQEGASEEDF